MKTKIFNLRQNLMQLIGKRPINCHCKQCEPGQVFECDICGRLMPWCMGASDGMEDSCDDCWCEAHGEVPYQSLTLFSNKR